jgi:hypothetical protein
LELRYVEETNNPSGIVIGAAVGVVEIEGFTNRPGDSLDGGPITGASKGNFGGFKNRPGDSLGDGPTTDASKGSFGAIFDAATAGATFFRSGDKGN